MRYETLDSAVDVPYEAGANVDARAYVDELIDQVNWVKSIDPNFFEGCNQSIEEIAERYGFDLDKLREEG